MSDLLDPDVDRAHPTRRDELSDLEFAEATYPEDVGSPDGRPWRDPHCPEVWLLHVRVHRRQDPAAIARLVDLYDGEAHALARRRGRHHSHEDLVQVAREGLVLAIRRFDPQRRRPFLPFARLTIDGMLRRHLRDRAYTIRPSRRTYELLYRVGTARESLTADLARRPTVSEIADVVGAAESDVREALQSVATRYPVSLDGPAGPDGGVLADTLGGEDRHLGVVVDRAALQVAIGRLTESERYLVYAYFFEGRTQSDLADELGVSQMSVSRSLARALRRLRTFIG